MAISAPWRPGLYAFSITLCCLQRKTCWREPKEISSEGGVKVRSEIVKASNEAEILLSWRKYILPRWVTAVMQFIFTCILFKYGMDHDNSNVWRNSFTCTSCSTYILMYILEWVKSWAQHQNIKNVVIDFIEKFLIGISCIFRVVIYMILIIMAVFWAVNFNWLMAVAFLNGYPCQIGHSGTFLGDKIS